MVKIYAKDPGDLVLSQISEIEKLDAFKDSQIAIMPDAHPGKGCVIGFTAVVPNNNGIIPNVIGVDIGCSVSTLKLRDVAIKDIDLKLLDEVIRAEVPSGFKVRSSPHPWVEAEGLNYRIESTLEAIQQEKKLNHFLCSVGTLGGGNHFIEVDVDADNTPYLTIHTGSRGFGYSIAEYWQNQADGLSSKMLLNDMADSYLAHLQVAQEFAKTNHKAIMETISKSMGWNTQVPQWNLSMHNYVELSYDHKQWVIRKGATSAKKDEVVLIPLNMRDGLLICKGKGNSEWNQSAPHGAGRLYGRGEAKRTISMDMYREAMKDVFSTSVTQATLDEAPMAYKDASMIKELITPTVEIVKHLKPIYNFKAED